MFRYLWLCLVILVGVAKGETMNWKVGIAKAVITPEKAVWLAGYGSKRVPEGKLHDLWMKVIALEDAEGHRAVMVTTDHMGIPKPMYENMVARIKERFGLDRSQVMFTFSHNHCGPRLAGDLIDYYPEETEQVELVREYTEAMEAKTVETVGEALSRLAPASLAFSEGDCAFAANRRNNREADLPAIMASGQGFKGPVDHAVPVVAVKNQKGELTGVLFGYACHATTLSFTYWCGDYPGFAQIALEKNHPGATAMFVPGCGGDQNPLPRRTLTLCEKYGSMLAQSVEKVLAQDMKPVPTGLKTAFEFVDLPYLKVMTREDLQAGLVHPNAIYARWAKRMLTELDAGETFASSYPYPVHVWKIGDIVFIALGAEAVVDYSLRFKKEFGPNTWVCGYADDLVAYIPSRRVWEEGGYEGGAHLYEYGRPALRWAGDVEDRIAGAVHRLAQQVGR